MDWILKHLQLVFAMAAAVAWWLNQRRLAGKEGAPEPHKEATFEDAELAERTRRIREEIQRKIEQRARAYTQPQPVAVPVAPVPAPPVVREAAVPAPVAAPQVNVPPERWGDERTAVILEQQSALTEQLRLADEVTVEARRLTLFENKISSSGAAAAVARGVLTDDLRSPNALRQAFLLREILGPPVALR